MTQLPLVSIITPAYNAERYLAETIDSVLGQDYQAIEYLVLDDGSTDRTARILDRYRGRIRAERHKNMGEARTVNRGFALTRGEYVAVVSADDPLLPGIVAEMVDAFRTRPNILVLYPDWTMIDETGEPIRPVETYEFSYLNMVRWHHCMPGPGAFMRRALIDEIGGRDPAFRFTSDFEFWLRAGIHGSFARLPRTLAQYRHHADATSVSQRGRERAREHIELAERLFALGRLPADVRSIRREAISSAYWIAGSVLAPEDHELRRAYWWKALALAPLKYVGEYRRSRLTAMIPVLLGIWYSRISRLALYRYAIRRRVRRVFDGT